MNAYVNALLRGRPGALSVLFAAVVLVMAAPTAWAQSNPIPPTGNYTVDEISDQGYTFFGEVTEGLATIVERSAASYGLPNAYILGQEGSGALVGGLRYGEGILYTKHNGQVPVFWQGPSVGPDVGGSGNRVMMLVYNLPDVDSIYRRYVGIAGTAHIVAGFGVSALGRDDVYVAPIISGVGARLGFNFGYLKFTAEPTWNPF